MPPHSTALANEYRLDGEYAEDLNYSISASASGVLCGFHFGIDTICQRGDGICQMNGHLAQPDATEVYPHAENKALLEKVTETKVTSDFGEADANI